ncbi:MAG: histidine phosphatase family protein [Melioribacteraceae bacterium]|nr:histidine phosphatase family protein [Melioribacteraceae bacterium]
MYIQRHGESEANAKHIFACRTYDPHITETGKIQILSQIEYYSKLNLTQIISSPSKRAIQTSEIIAERLSIPISIDEALLEVDLGKLDGKPESENGNLELYHNTLEDWFFGNRSKSFPEGESYNDVIKRAETIYQKYSNLKNLLLVGHATFFACLIGMKKAPKNVLDNFLPRGGRARLENGNWIIHGKEK